MAGSFGYGLRGFTSGFQTGVSLRMEKDKVDALKKEQERKEKLAKQKEENATNWYNTNKDNLVNFQTQPQDIRNALIFESVKYGDDWHKYLRDCENALQDGDLEQIKHLNDMEEEKIKAERDMLNLGVKPENAFIGKYYSKKDMDYVKKLRMGALANKPIGTRMYEEQFGELPAETKVPSISDYGTGLKYLTNIVNVPPENWETAKKGLESKFGIDYSGITQEVLRETEIEDKSLNLYSAPEEVMANVKAPAGLTVIPKRDNKTGKYYGSFSKGTAPTPEGEVTAGEIRTQSMASTTLFGSSDWTTGISKPGIIPVMISNKLNMGQPLTDEEKTEVRNNYNMIKGTLPEEVTKIVEAQLQRYGIPLEIPSPTPEPTPEPQPKKWWEFWKEGTKPITPEVTPEVTPGIIPTAEKIPTPKVSTENKEAMIPMMTKKELEDAIKGLDPSDPMYKLLYDEAVKRGYIKK